VGLFVSSVSACKKYQASKQRQGFYPLACNTEKWWHLFSYNKIKIGLLQNLPRLCLFFIMLVFIIFIIGILRFLSKNIYCSWKSNLLQPTDWYTVLQETDKTWPILDRPVLKYVMFLQKYKKKHVFLDTIYQKVCL
jgi:hypothetical protein